VERALAAIDAGEVEKVVLARTLRVETDALIDPRLLARRFNAGEPVRSCSSWRLVEAPPPGGRLAGTGVRRRGRKVFSDPLAGTPAVLRIGRVTARSLVNCSKP